MKKIIVLLLISVLSVTLISCNKENKTSKIKDITVHSDYIRYEYIPLKNVSELIVKAKVQDDLSEKNSTIEKDSNDPDSISNFSAVREIKILDVFAGNEKIKPGDILMIIEDAAVDGEHYYHGENYKSLQKGEEYILFLSTDNFSGEYSIISADNGKVCTSDLTDMKNLDEENFEIAVKALVDFNSNLSNEEKERIIESKIYKSNSESLSKEIELDTNMIQYGYTDKGLEVNVE